MPRQTPLASLTANRTTYTTASLPPYLRQLILSSLSHPNSSIPAEISPLPLPIIRTTHPNSPATQYVRLLLLRHHLTHQISLLGRLAPELVLERARVYEALGYPELAVGDAMSVWRVGEYAEEGGGDLGGVWFVDDDDAVDGSGEGRAGRRAEEVREDEGGRGSEEVEGKDEEDEGEEGEDLEEDLELQVLIASVKLGSAGVIARSLRRLNAEKAEVERWEGVLRELRSEAGQDEQPDDEDVWCIFPDEVFAPAETIGAFSRGASRREIYPWNELEGDRMSESALNEINGRLRVASQGMLEVRKSILPTLSTAQNGDLSKATAQLDLNDQPNKAEPSENAQLGLFATRDLPPNTTILTERSALTAIRPHGASLCDACAGDLEPRAPNSPQQQTCPACGIPFCSPECLQTALETYHTPNLNDESTDEGFPPATAPFCPGSAGEADIANLGRAESSATPEWDLYFLLVVRALQMAETLDVHPLQVWECEWLWGDFNPNPTPTTLNNLTGADKIKRTLPFSLRHHTDLPLQLFELLLLSRPSTATPYSPHWLERYDWWVIQTLYAKFRGVADAKLSSWSGEPETASVFPLWCLANHSCEAGVSWEGGGVRRLMVRGERVGGDVGGGELGEWEGVKEGEEVWNHYTDVREGDYRVRRERLVEVLGGECRCGRCLREEAAALQEKGG